MEFDLEKPHSVSRNVVMKPGLKMSGAFHLPKFNQSTFEIEGFIGDVERGGSCNVRVQSFSPHNLTHIESSLHIVTNGHPISEFARKMFQGLVYLIDLSHKPVLTNQTITVADINEKLEKLNPQCKLLAIKTNYSNEAVDRDFSNTSPVALDPDLTEFLSSQYPQIHGIFLDLPSADLENDGGKLLAHRKFFLLPDTGYIADSHPLKYIGELLYFKGIDEGYYFTIITPYRLETDAVITDIIFYSPTA